MTKTQHQSSKFRASHFQFEADFVSSLKCIPMLVRMKLDNCGVKLKLSHWNQFNQAERETLVDMPCDNETERRVYKEQLQNLIELKTGKPASELTVDPNPPWLDKDQIPASVLDKAQSFQINLTIPQWSNLTPPQRFALIKLSRPSHENKNFIPALREFGIITAT